MFDSHCHLDFPEFAGSLSRLLSEAEGKGVTGWVVPGCSPSQWTRLPSLRGAHPRGLHLAVGVHPYWSGHILDLDVLAQDLRQSAETLGAVALGECGLHNRPLRKDSLCAYGGAVAANESEMPDLANLSRQQAILRVHLRVARERGLPVILHHVGAQAELFASLREEPLGERGGVVHGFSGDAGFAQALIARGLYLGIGPAVTRLSRHRLRDAIAKVPLERLLLETDAPDQVPYDAENAERMGVPADLARVCEEVADLKGCSTQEVAEVTEASAQRLFGLPGRA